MGDLVKAPCNLREMIASGDRKVFFHFRFIDLKGRLNPRCGVTVCYAVQDGKASLSSAVCSLKDNYVKRAGRIKSVCRFSAVCEKERKFVKELDAPIEDQKLLTLEAYNLAVKMVVESLPVEAKDELLRSGQYLVITPSRTVVER